MKAIAAITVGCLSLTSCSAVKHMNADDWGRLVDLGQKIIQDARALGADTEEVKAAIDEVKAREDAQEKAVENGETVPVVETVK